MKKLIKLYEFYAQLFSKIKIKEQSIDIIKSIIDSIKLFAKQKSKEFYFVCFMTLHDINSIV